MAVAAVGARARVCVCVCGSLQAPQRGRSSTRQMKRGSAMDAPQHRPRTAPCGHRHSVTHQRQRTRPSSVRVRGQRPRGPLSRLLGPNESGAPFGRRRTLPAEDVKTFGQARSHNQRVVRVTWRSAGCAPACRCLPVCVCKPCVLFACAYSCACVCSSGSAASVSGPKRPTSRPGDPSQYLSACFLHAIFTAWPRMEESLGG